MIYLSQIWTESLIDWLWLLSESHRFRTAGIKDTINGPFVFSPDGNPMIGPVPGMKNYWTAVGVMAGFCQAGGVGKTLAEWMIEGEPSS